ncbi:MAG: TonB-dependent receptor [Pseudomonadota bacterium]
MMRSFTGHVGRVFGLTALAALTATRVAAQGEGETLGQDVIEMPEITVFGSARDERDLLDSPNAVSVVGRDEVLRRQPSTYEELIGDQPGVTIEGGPRGIAQEPNIRGFQDEQVIIRVDGARQNFDLAHRGRFFTDPTILEDVEILRGGASTLFGSGALGGVIFIDTLDAADLLIGDQPFAADFKLGVNSQGPELIGAQTSAAQFGQVDLLTFFVARRLFGDLEDGDGEPIIGSAIDTNNGLVKLGWEPNPDHRFEARYQIFEDGGLTPPNANVQGTPETLVDRDLLYQTAQLQWDWAPSGNDLIDLSAIAYYNDAEVSEDRLFDGRFDETDFETIGFEVTNVSGFEGFGLPIRASYGFEFFQDEQEAERDGMPREQAPDATRRFYGIFAQADFDVTSTITVTPGLRFDLFSLDPEGGGVFEDRTESQLSPRLALQWRPNDNIQLFATASRNFRAPTLTELYVDGVHFITPGFPLGPGTTFTGVNEFVPTPDLEPETSVQVEFGGRVRFDDVARSGDQLFVGGNVYVARVDDFIDTVVTFVDFDTGVFNPISGAFEVSGTTTNQNVDAILFGFEAEVEYDAGNWFAAANLTIPRGHERGTGIGLGSIPQDRLVLTGGIRPFRDMEIGARATLADGIEEGDVPPDSLTTPGFAVFDLFANYTPQDGPLAGATFSAGIDNFTNRKFRIHPNGLPNTGINGKVAVTLRF